MLEYLTLGEFVVAALMAVAALCAFVWGMASGAFRDVEGVKHDVLRVEEGAWGSVAPEARLGVAGPPCSKDAHDG
jgi:cbb3-type cytochrome oxidase maturation protein